MVLNSVERAADFINAIGVDTHMTYDRSSYGTVSTVLASLQYLGIVHVRDGDIGTLINLSYYYNQDVTLAEAGIKFDFGLSSQQTLADDLYFLNAMETAVPGSVYAVEGANEVNDSTPFFTGKTGISAVLPATAAIYNAITSDAALSGVFIYSNTFPTPSEAGAAAQVGDLSSYVTDGAAHIYFQSLAPQTGLPSIAQQTLDAPGDPKVITETGYSTDPGNVGSNGAMNTNEDVQAKYTLDLLFDDIKAGVQSVYIYELLDEYSDPDDTSSQEHYGLFNYDGTPKPAAIAIHNLTAILADTSATADTFTTSDLNYTISGLSQTTKTVVDGIQYINYGGASFLMEKSNGAFDLTVWAEPEIWNYATVTEMVAPPSLATVKFDQIYQTIEVFDPMVSSSPIEILHNVSRLQVVVTDHPIIIEVEPNSAVAVADAVTAAQPVSPERDVFDISGTAAGQSASDNASLQPFSQVQITDSQTAIGAAATVILNDENGNATDANGSLSGAGLTRSGIGTYYITAASFAALSVKLESLVFTPTNHQVAPGQVVTTKFTIVLSDGSNTNIDTSSSVRTVAQETPPGIAGAVVKQAIQDIQTIQPFAKAVITDVDAGAVDSVTITLTNAGGAATDANGTLSGTGLIKTGIGTYSLAATTPAALNAELEQLDFTPALAQVKTGQSVTTGFDLAVSDGILVSSNTVTSVVTTAAGPSVTGTWSPLIRDNSVQLPMHYITVTDVAASGAETAIVTLDDANGNPTDANGFFSGAGLSKAGTGTYSIEAASAAAMTTALKALTFTPSSHQATPGQTVATEIFVSISDGVHTGFLEVGTVSAVAQETAPSISGTAANQAIDDIQTIQPFAKTVITDPDFAAADHVTITLTNTDGVATDANGSLFGIGLTKTGTGTYDLATASPGALTMALEHLQFRPTQDEWQPGQHVTTRFNLAVSDGMLSTANTTATVVSTGAGPTLSGAWSPVIRDNSVQSPMHYIVVSDLRSGTETATIVLRGSSGVVTDANGLLSGAGLSKLAAGTYSITAASATAMSIALKALVFTPAGHEAAPGQTVATEITLSVSDGVNSESFDVGTVSAVAQETAPAIGGTLANQAIQDIQTIRPFTKTVITDPDFAAADKITVTLTDSGGIATDANGSLSGTGLSKIGAGIYNLAATTPAALTAELEQLQFTPMWGQTQPGQSITTHFNLTVSDGTLAAANTTTTVVTTATGLTITGGWSPVIRDNSVQSPMHYIVVSDLRGGTETATIILRNSSGVATDANGVLAGAGLSKTGAGTYSITAGSAAAMTTALKALVFTPTGHQVAPGQTVTTDFLLSVFDGAASGSFDVGAVSAVSQETAPSISGAVANQAIEDIQATHPFAQAMITDPDFAAAESIAITLVNGGAASDANGTLSGAGLSKTGVGTYSLAATTPATATAELEQLLFTPAITSQRLVTGLDLTVFDGTLSATNTSTFLVSASANAETVTTIAGGGFILSAAANATGTIAFAGSNAILTVEGTTLPTATITGFDLNNATGDEIVLTGFTYAASADSATLGAGNVLALDLNGITETLNIDPTADYTGHSFAVQTNDLDQVVVIDPVSGAASAEMKFAQPNVIAVPLDKAALFVAGFVSKAVPQFASASAVVGSTIHSVISANIVSASLNDLAKQSALISAKPLHGF